MSLRAKLHPRRFPGLSSRMAAVAGYVLGERWTTPQITEMFETLDGVVLAATSTDPLMNSLIGSGDDVRRNWSALLDDADLEASEREAADRLFGTRLRKAC